MAEETGDYQRHDGRELELLLSGAKPLAAFVFYEGADELACLARQDFASAVADGLILRFEHQTELDDLTVQHLLFTTPSESWRAPAYMHLIKFMYERDWCDHLEWLQGSLLGYSDQENSLHIRKKNDLRKAAKSNH